MQPKHRCKQTLLEKIHKIFSVDLPRWLNWFNILYKKILLWNTVSSASSQWEDPVFELQAYMKYM